MAGGRRSSARLRGALSLFAALAAGGAGGWARAETALVVWGDSDWWSRGANSLPIETRAALEAAPGIARLEATSGTFAAVTTEGRWYVLVARLVVVQLV